MELKQRNIKSNKISHPEIKSSDDSKLEFLIDTNTDEAVRKIIFNFRDDDNDFLLKKSAIINLNDYIRQFDGVENASNINDVCVLNEDIPLKSMANCANCGIWYDSDTGKFTQVISPLSLAIDNLMIKEAVLPNACKAIEKDYHRYRTIHDISNIYTSYIQSILNSYFYSFAGNISDKNNKFRLALSNLTSFNEDHILSNFVTSYIDTKKSLNGNINFYIVNPIVMSYVSEVSTKLACRINDLINCICYGGLIKPNITFDIWDEENIIDILNSYGAAISTTSELFLFLNKLFFPQLNGCSKIIEILLWQCMQTIDYCL